MLTGYLIRIAGFKYCCLTTMTIALILLMACSTGTSAITKPAVTFLGVTLSKAVDKKGEIAVPIAPATTFTIKVFMDDEYVEMKKFDILKGNG